MLKKSLMPHEEHMRNIKLRGISDNYDKLASPNPDAKLRSSIGLDENMGEFFYLHVNNLISYPKQARKYFDLGELNQLSETIREHGVLQPLSVIKTEIPGVYQVISGERRLRASRIAGLEKIPCIIVSESAQTEEIAVIENIQRSDLHPIELSNAYSSLLRNFNHGDKSKLAKKLSVPNSHVSEILALIKIPQEIKEYLVQKNIRSRKILRKVVACDDINHIKNILGINNNVVNSKGKRKFIYTFFIKNGEVDFQENSYKLTGKQKVNLKERLLKVIESLEK